MNKRFATSIILLFVGFSLLISLYLFFNAKPNAPTIQITNETDEISETKEIRENLPSNPPVDKPPVTKATEASKVGADIPAKNESIINTMPDYWKPKVNTSWQIQLTDLPVNQSYDVTMYDIDLFDNSAAVISTLHSKGRKVICYFSAGSWEDWRPDSKLFPSEVLGSSNGWPGEKWLDIRNLDTLGPIMEARLDLAKQKGCDGVDPDNVDGYSNKTGFPLKYSDQLAYNKFIANAAHSRGLSVGLKNDVEQVGDLVSYFDWQINEQCFEYEECETLIPFISAGKPVFNIEYNLDMKEFCPEANNMNFNSLKKDLELTEQVTPCR